MTGIHIQSVFYSRKQAHIQFKPPVTIFNTHATSSLYINTCAL